MSKRLNLALMAVFAMMMFPGSAWAKRVALVIANGKYLNAEPLRNPPADGRLIAASLKRAGFDMVDVRLDMGKNALETALKDFGAKAEGADVAMIYYAGHGIEAGGQNYLIPTDAKLLRDRDLEVEATRLDTLLLMAEGARLKIIVLDACRNNPFATSMQRTLRNRAVGRGLAAVEPEGETLVVYAAKAGATAADGEGANSPFAEAMAARLPQAGLEISLLFRAVRDDVLKKTGRVQEPFTYGSISGQAFYFVPGNAQIAVAPVGNPQVPQPVVPVVSSETTEVLYWQGTVSANTEQGYRDYLKRYPKGQFADVARQNLARFAQPKPAVQQARPMQNPPPAANAGTLGSAMGLSDFAGLLGKTTPTTPGSGTSREFAFTPSATLRRQLVQKFLASNKTGNPIIDPILTAFFSTPDPFKTIGDEFRKNGLSTDNMADTLTFFLGALGSAAQGDETDSPPHQIKAAQRQIAAVLSLDQSARNMTATERQTLSDNMVLYTGFVAVLYATAKIAGPDALSQFQNQIGDLSKTTMGIDARKLRLTDSGFDLSGQ